MNQTQIKAIEAHLTNKVRDAFRAKRAAAQKRGEKVRYPEMEKLATKLAMLQKEATALNEKHAHDEDAQPYIENANTSRWNSSDYAVFTFKSGSHTALDEAERKSLSEVSNFVLALTLGEATLADVEKFLATLLK